MSVTTIDCEYTGEQGVAAAYLAIDGDEAAFVETNTNHATQRLLLKRCDLLVVRSACRAQRVACDEHGVHEENDVAHELQVQPARLRLAV